MVRTAVKRPLQPSSLQSLRSPHFQNRRFAVGRCDAGSYSSNGLITCSSCSFVHFDGSGSRFLVGVVDGVPEHAELFAEEFVCPDGALSFSFVFVVISLSR
jgi:hypothetical protein